MRARQTYRQQRSANWMQLLWKPLSVALCLGMLMPGCKQDLVHPQESRDEQNRTLAIPREGQLPRPEDAGPTGNEKNVTDSDALQIGIEELVGYWHWEGNYGVHRYFRLSNDGVCEFFIGADTEPKRGKWLLEPPMVHLYLESNDLQLTCRIDLELESPTRMTRDEWIDSGDDLPWEKVDPKELKRRLSL